jgi:hypothetical protein
MQNNHKNERRTGSARDQPLPIPVLTTQSLTDVICLIMRQNNDMMDMKRRNPDMQDMM